MNVVMHCGLSAEDLATETLDKYLLSPNGLGWRESKGPLVAFLGTVLRNKFIDYMRHQKEVPRCEPDSHETGQPTPTSLVDDLAFREFVERLLSLIKGREDEAELKDLILKSPRIKGKGKRNQQLADLMGVDEAEVIARRNRLLRVAGIKEAFKEFRDGRTKDKSHNQGHRAGTRESS